MAVRTNFGNRSENYSVPTKSSLILAPGKQEPEFWPAGEVNLTAAAEGGLKNFFTG